jgi:thiol-disulfide isomerase/thioredoxin
MKRAYLLAVLLVGAAAISFAQNTMMGTSSSNAGASDMMSPNTSNNSATEMMGTSTSGGGTDSMMSAKPMTADPAVGHELRFAPSTGTKVTFTTLAAAEALAAKQPTVLFFAADWCPYCQADLKDINANGGKLGNVAIVVANYDTAKKLKAMYGITVQDTFVQIDAAGKQMAIWNGGGAGVDGILGHIVRS